MLAVTSCSARVISCGSCCLSWNPGLAEKVRPHSLHLYLCLGLAFVFLRHPCFTNFLDGQWWHRFWGNMSVLLASMFLALFHARPSGMLTATVCCNDPAPLLLVGARAHQARRAQYHPVPQTGIGTEATHHLLLLFRLIMSGLSAMACPFAFAALACFLRADALDAMC